MFLEFNEVSFKYNDTIALDNVSCGLNKGEITGLIGSNGAGKTTTILNIVRNLRPLKGQITIEGTDICKITNDNY